MFYFISYPSGVSGNVTATIRQYNPANNTFTQRGTFSVSVGYGTSSVTPLANGYFVLGVDSPTGNGGSTTNYRRTTVSSPSSGSAVSVSSGNWVQINDTLIAEVGAGAYVRVYNVGTNTFSDLFIENNSNQTKSIGSFIQRNGLAIRRLEI